MENNKKGKAPKLEVRIGGSGSMKNLHLTQEFGLAAGPHWEVPELKMIVAGITLDYKKVAELLAQANLEDGKGEITFGFPIPTKEVADGIITNLAQLKEHLPSTEEYETATKDFLDKDRKEVSEIAKDILNNDECPDVLKGLVEMICQQTGIDVGGDSELSKMTNEEIEELYKEMTNR